MADLKPTQRHRRDVAMFVAAGGDETVQRVTTAVHMLSRALNKWYDERFADLDLSGGEWSVITALAREGGRWGLSPSVLAQQVGASPAAMTPRLDRLADRNLVWRASDPDNRVRVLVSLTDDGWHVFRSVIEESNHFEAYVLRELDLVDQTHLAELLEHAVAGLNPD